MKPIVNDYLKILLTSAVLIVSLCSLNSIQKFESISEGLVYGIQGIYGFIIMYIFSLCVFQRKGNTNKPIALAGLLTFPLLTALYLGIVDFHETCIALLLIVCYMLASLVAYFIHNKELHVRVGVLFIVANILLYMAGYGYNRIIALML